MNPSKLLKNRKKIFSSGDLTFFADFTPKTRRLEFEPPLPLTQPEITQKNAQSAEQILTTHERRSHALDILSKKFKNFYLNELYCDFTVNVGDREFQVHKFILAARSPVFAAMMEHDMEESKNGVLNVTDCDPDAFHVFLLNLYSFETEALSAENAFNVYVIADKYGVDYLKADCIEYIENSLTIDTFCDVITLAVTYNELKLLATFKDYFTRNARKIIQTVKWDTLMEENTAIAKELLLLVLPP